MMEQDREWEDAAFNTRHLHNRNDRGGHAVRHEFEVRNTFGTHLVKCVALDRLQESVRPGSGSAKPAGKSASGSAKKTGRSNSNGGGTGDAVLEIYRLTDGGEGILGLLRCPGIFEATAVFSGSRKTLSSITRHLGRVDPQDTSPTPPGHGGAVEGADHAADEDDEDEEDDGDHAHLSSGEDADGTTSRERRQRKRIATFEKNSFRQPKFWFRWQGVVVDGAGETVKAHGSGYIVFSGNDCKRFQGTLTSEELGWNNAKMSGFKTKPQPERDFEFRWSREA